MSVHEPVERPSLAVWKLASCDGCQLALLDCEDELLAALRAFDVARLLLIGRDDAEGPFDVSLVEGSVTTARDLARVQWIRARSRCLVTIGACAAAGGIQALRNLRDHRELLAAVYPSPERLDVLERSTPLSAHVEVDYEIPGCPVDRALLLDALLAIVSGREPRIPDHAVCADCKLAGAICISVARGTPCMGPVTRGGCGALCPRFGRGCYGCFGPFDVANAPSLSSRWRELGVEEEEIERAYHAFHPWNESHDDERDGRDGQEDPNHSRR